MLLNPKFENTLKLQGTKTMASIYLHEHLFENTLKLQGTKTQKY